MPDAGHAVVGLSPAIRAWTVALFERLRDHSFDGVGISRATYGPGESDAMRLVADAAVAEGLTVEWDAAANLIVTLAGQDPDAPAAACGSHLDSVPQGGNFDGAAGVLAGLAAMVALKRAGTVPPHPIKLFVLRGEESAWFGKCYLGSSALFGKFDTADFPLKQSATGETLESAMLASGADLRPLKAHEPLLAAGALACFLELHIEQGPVMVARGIPVGIVTGIRGNLRHPRAICRGEAAHSGAVPRWLRHDAVFAMADFVGRLDRHWEELLQQGEDLVLTFGIFGTDPAEHAMSRVPGSVRFSLEWRSQSTDVLAGFAEVVAAEAEKVSKARGVSFDFGARVPTAPAVMDAALVERLRGLASARGIPHETLPSGAGHDAAIFANEGIPTAMIFIRNEHGSHNPHEAMDYEDFFLGAELLMAGLMSVPA